MRRVILYLLYGSIINIKVSEVTPTGRKQCMTIVLKCLLTYTKSILLTKKLTTHKVLKLLKKQRRKLRRSEKPKRWK